MYRLAINDQNIRRCSTGGQLIDRRKLSAVTHSAASVSPPSSLIRGWLFSQENGLVAAATQREDRSESVGQLQWEMSCSDRTSTLYSDRNG